MKNEKTPKKEDIKTTGQVIIRREVIVNDDDKKNDEKELKNNKSDIGFTQRRNKNYNIVYREKPTKPMTVSELFGIKPKKDAKKENSAKVTTASDLKEEAKVTSEKSEESSLLTNKDEKKVVSKNVSERDVIVAENEKNFNANNESNKNTSENVNENSNVKVSTVAKETANANVNAKASDNTSASSNVSVNADNANSNIKSNIEASKIESADSNSAKNSNASQHTNSNLNLENDANSGIKNEQKTNSQFNAKNNTNLSNREFGRDSRGNFGRGNAQGNVYSQNGYQRRENGYSNGNSQSGRDFQRNRNSSFNNRNSGFRSNGYNRNSDSNSFNGSNSSNGFNRQGGFQRNGFRNDQRQSDNRQSNFQSGKRPFGNNNSFQKRSFEKNLNDIVSTEFTEKDNKKDYATKIIDKQKANRNFDDKKKNSKNRRLSEEEDYSEDKLRNLKQVDKLSNMFEDQEGGMLDYYDLTTARGKKNKKGKKKDEPRKQKIFELKSIIIPEHISVKDLATELKKTSAEIIKKLLELGIMANINQDLDFDTAYLVADSYGVTATKKEVVKDEDILFDDSEDKEEDLLPRPPVVCVMGHVDHGKTSLLDAIRKTNVIEGEAGGITQHIGAYKVNANGREITFLDTPGHEAFTSMRARGAQITDIAILVVAADDGVMPQTVEAINHAKAAGTPIIVAINKIDLPGANIEKVKQELMKYELVPEEWGGDTIFVPISAKKGINIDNLLEMVLLVADMQNLRANPNKQSKGTVIEARLDRTQGPIASVLVQRGTLNVGDTIILGTSIGKIRTMTNDKGKKVKEAGPSTPVEITGLSAVPEAGDVFYEVKNEKVAKHLIEKRKLESREKSIANDNAVTLDNLFEKMESEELKQLNVIAKADVQGTAEALKSSLEKLSNDEVRVKVLHSSAGGVTESDVELAKAANAIIIAFNVRPVGSAKKVAEKEGVEIKQYSVIYQALEDVENAMKGMLEPVYHEITLGNAEVRQTFKITNVGTIAGCYVTDGKVARNAGVRVIRDGVVIHEGKLVSLKRFKDDAKEVSNGFECGVQIEGFDDLQVGDIIEAYIKKEVKR